MVPETSAYMSIFEEMDASTKMESSGLRHCENHLILKPNCTLLIRFTPPSFYEEDNIKHKKKIRDTKDVNYTGNFKDVIHIFSKLDDKPHKNLGQATFETGLRKSLQAQSTPRFDLIPYKNKEKNMVCYLPPSTVSANKAILKLPYYQKARPENIKSTGESPRVTKITSL